MTVYHFLRNKIPWYNVTHNAVWCCWSRHPRYIGSAVYRLKNTFTTSCNTTVKQMTEMFQWPTCLSKKWPKCFSENKLAWEYIL